MVTAAAAETRQGLRTVSALVRRVTTLGAPRRLTTSGAAVSEPSLANIGEKKWTERRALKDTHIVEERSGQHLATGPVIHIATHCVCPCR